MYYRQGLLDSPRQLWQQASLYAPRWGQVEAGEPRSTSHRVIRSTAFRCIRSRADGHLCIDILVTGGPLEASKLYLPMELPSSGGLGLA